MVGDDRLGDIALLAWLSPAFPVGAFAYSHGLEAAVDAGDIIDAHSLTQWLIDLVEHGSGFNDAVIASAAWRAARDDDSAALREVNDLALALMPARERRLEGVGMGTAFATTIRAAWPTAAFASMPEGEIAYPVAFGSACAQAGVALEPSLEGFLLAFVQNLVSATVRLGPVGQTDGQRVAAALLPAVRRRAADAGRSTLDDIGGVAQRSDIAAMRHETLYSRLFRS